MPSSSFARGGPSALSDEDAQYEDLSSIIEPGPIDASVLTMQAQHRSSDVWVGKDDNLVLEVRRHNMWPVDERIAPYIANAGFFPWTLVQNMKVDHALLTALVERWRSETHTFHLRAGEMTPTLCDVGVITGLPVDGIAVTGSEAVVSWDGLCEASLGRIPEQGKTKSSVKLTWFKENMLVILEDAIEIDLERYARAYL